MAFEVSINEEIDDRRPNRKSATVGVWCAPRNLLEHIVAIAQNLLRAVRQSFIDRAPVFASFECIVDTACHPLQLLLLLGVRENIGRDVNTGHSDVLAKRTPSPLTSKGFFFKWVDRRQWCHVRSRLVILEVMRRGR